MSGCLSNVAATAARDPCFGLHLGAALHPRDLGLVGYLGANAATLGDVLDVAAKYLRLLTEGTRVEVEAAGERVRVAQHILDPAGAGSRQVAGLGAASLVRVARLLTGTMLAPAWVELPFDCRDGEAEHQRVLGAPVRLGQSRTAVVLERQQLALRAVGADPGLFDLLEQVCRERVGALPDRRVLRARAENVIIELLPYSTPSLDRVARRLGTSSRSLGRRLAEEGTSFKALVDDLRHQADRDGRYRRGEHRTQHGHDPIGREHDRHGGHLDNCDGSPCQSPYPIDQERPLVRRRIDEDADRGMQRNPDQFAYGQHQADRGLVPVRIAEQKDADIEPQPAAHVGEQEIDQIETVVEGHRQGLMRALRARSVALAPDRGSWRYRMPSKLLPADVPGFCRSGAMLRRCPLLPLRLCAGFSSAANAP